MVLFDLARTNLLVASRSLGKLLRSTCLDLGLRKLTGVIPESLAKQVHSTWLGIRCGHELPGSILCSHGCLQLQMIAVQVVHTYITPSAAVFGTDCSNIRRMASEVLVGSTLTDSLGLGARRASLLCNS